jgi:hypothetical protein
VIIFPPNFSTSFSFRNATDIKNSTARSISGFLSAEISGYKTSIISFTAAAFQNKATKGFYYSSKPNDNISLSDEVIEDYDDKCVMFHFYENQSCVITYDTEKSQDFVTIDNDPNLVFSGSGDFRTSDPFCVCFVSGFSSRSRFVDVSCTSDESISGESGWLPAYELPRSTQPIPHPPHERDPLSWTIIVIIIVVVVLVVVAILVIVLYCLCRRRQAVREDASDEDLDREVRIHPLVSDQVYESAGNVGQSFIVSYDSDKSDSLLIV